MVADCLVETGAVLEYVSCEKGRREREETFDMSQLAMGTDDRYVQGRMPVPPHSTHAGPTTRKFSIMYLTCTYNGGTGEISSLRLQVPSPDVPRTSRSREA